MDTAEQQQTLTEHLRDTVWQSHRTENAPFPRQTVFASDSATYRKRCHAGMMAWATEQLTRYPLCPRNEAWVRLQGLAEIATNRPLYLDESSLLASCLRVIFAVRERETQDTDASEVESPRHERIGPQIVASLQLNRVRNGLDTVLAPETITELSGMLDEHDAGLKISCDRLASYLRTMILSHRNLAALLEGREDSMAVAI